MSGVRAPSMALILLAAAVVLTGGVEAALLAHDYDGPLFVVELFPVAGIIFAAAGLVAWERRPSNQLGAIMVVGGFAWLVAALVNTEVTVLEVAGTVLQTVALGVVIHLLLAFPSGKLQSRMTFATVVLAYFVCLVLQIPHYLFIPASSPGGLLAVADRPDLAAAAKWVQQGIGIAVVVSAAVILIGRLRRSSTQHRRVLGPLYVYGTGAVVFISFAPNVLRSLLGISAAATAALQITALIGVPVAFTVGLLAGGFARTSDLQQLGVWLGSTVTSRPPLLQALSRALGDESVQLAYWTAEQDGYVDGQGRPLEVPREGSGRNSALIEVGGRRVGAVFYDSVLIGNPELVRSAGRVVGIAVEQEWMTGELLASREALRLSSARIVAAGDRERRRIARDLHDGLQMQLVLLALEAQRLAGDPAASPSITVAATTLRLRIDAAAGELRKLVYDIMPAPLVERGLEAATRDLVDRMPLPTKLDLDVAGSIPESASSAAYFVIAEALANAVKHSGATGLVVRVGRSDDDIVVEVADNGIGGAAPGEGLGLRSLADRVGVLGGSLRIHSVAGGGTRVVAELPCGS